MVDDNALRHHLDIASLMSCSAGSQPEALAAVIASHLAVCPQCRASLSRLSCVGEALFEGLPQAKLQNDWPVEALNNPTPHRVDRGQNPSSLTERLKPLEWKPVGIGARAATLPLSPLASGDLCILDLAPGTQLPQHALDKAQLTFVMTGSFRDERGTFRPGDIVDREPQSNLSSVADPLSGCVCLIASDTALIYRSSAASGSPTA
jgi:putative transcriptional regulator